MRILYVSFAAIVLQAAQPGAPMINPSGIVNAANGEAAVAPYSIVTLYGANLFYGGTATANATSELPATVAGVTVQIGGRPAGLFYVSSDQINLMIPNSIAPGTYPVMVVRSGVASQAVPIVIQAFAPGIFAATHADSTPITPDAPAISGEIVVLYATGLGPTIPNPPDLSIASSAAPIAQLAAFQVLLDGATLDSSLVEYAGLAPYNAGLYQINVRLPPDLSPDNPEIVLSVAGVESQPGFVLITSPGYSTEKRARPLPPSQGKTPPVI